MNSYINNILLEFFDWDGVDGGSAVAAGGTLDLIQNDCFYCPNKDTYPPFKNGRYLEEYLFNYAKRIVGRSGARVVYDRTGKLYIPSLWTNFQIEGWFDRERDSMQRALDKFIDEHPCPAGYFTFVQHDDGPKLRLPENTLVYGACSGNIPLPLIYEDADQRLVRACLGAGAGAGAGSRVRDIFASFVGTDTHRSRSALINMYKNNPRFVFSLRGGWSAEVDTNSQKSFIDLSLRSKFVLCPRGYGRSSFRFFEVLKMPGAGIPVYIWDDHEWLPYKDILDYSRFCVSINVKDMGRLQEILENISDEKYLEMKREGAVVASVFGLEFMCRFLVGRGAGAA